jgi:hypothetical protein
VAAEGLSDGGMVESGINKMRCVLEGECQRIATTRQRMRLELGGDGGMGRRGGEREVATVAQAASRKE